MDRYAAVAPDLARTIECQSAIWRALSVSRFRGSRFFSCQTLLIQGRDALDLVRPEKGHASKREDHGGPITSSSHVFTNPEFTKLDFFFHEICHLYYKLYYMPLLMVFHLRIKVQCQYKCYFYLSKWQLELQIENSGFRENMKRARTWWTSCWGPPGWPRAKATAALALKSLSGVLMTLGVR